MTDAADKKPAAKKPAAKAPPAKHYPAGVTAARARRAAAGKG